MNYLLDTNACIAILNDDPRRVRVRMELERKGGEEISISSIVLFELWFGASKSVHRDETTRKLEFFLTELVSVLPLDDQDARAAGEIRAAAEIAGKPIGTYDYLIAGQALRRGMILVTANTREFSRVKGLQWQDWSKA
jgi:tRNA(fMet)-specific endonuclease VapC